MIERQPTPDEVFKAMQAALRRAKRRHAPPDVIARYEREVQRVKDWRAAGAPLPPLYVTHFDPLTEQTWVYARAQDTAPPNTDPTTPATVSMEWPGGIVLHQLVERLVRELIPPTGAARAELERALNGLVHEPPAGVDAARWGYEHAKLWVTLAGLHDALVDAHKEWTGRIGSGKGSGKVTGVPAAGVIGYAKWLQQEAPQYARRWLLERAEVSRPKEEVDWPTLETGAFADVPDEGALETIERAVFGDYEPDDPRVVRLAQVLLLANDRERLVLLAELRPEREALVEAAATVARAPLTDFEQRVLATDCKSDREIADVTGIAYAQVPAYRLSLRKKIEKLPASGR